MAEKFTGCFVCRADSLQCRTWDDGAVVYDDHTGRTHQLDIVAGLVLTSLLESESGVTAAQLVLRLEGQIELADNDGADLRSAVQSALSEFERLGLIQPVIS
jgi:PqqD family protein of HPr-rel-A system